MQNKPAGKYKQNFHNKKKTRNPVGKMNVENKAKSIQGERGHKNNSIPFLLFVHPETIHIIHFVAFINQGEKCFEKTKNMEFFLTSLQNLIVFWFVQKNERFN